MWLGCHAPCAASWPGWRQSGSWWVTDSTVDSDGTSACRPHPISRSPSNHRLLALADWLSQHGCCHICDDHLAGKYRHTCGHEVMSGGLPASLPGRLTESMDGSKDRIGPGLDS